MHFKRTTINLVVYHTPHVVFLAKKLGLQEHFPLTQAVLTPVHRPSTEQSLPKFLTVSNSKIQFHKDEL